MCTLERPEKYIMRRPQASTSWGIMGRHDKAQIVVGMLVSMHALQRPRHIDMTLGTAWPVKGIIHTAMESIQCEHVCHFKLAPGQQAISLISEAHFLEVVCSPHYYPDVGSRNWDGFENTGFRCLLNLFLWTSSSSSVSGPSFRHSQASWCLGHHPHHLPPQAS
jgi:hypothetical protein